MEGLKGWCKEMGQLALLRKGRKDPSKGGEMLKPGLANQLHQEESGLPCSPVDPAPDIVLSTQWMLSKYQWDD